MAENTLALAIISGLLFGTLLALTAVGLTLVFGVLDIPNFAQGEFATLAAFATISLTSLGLGLGLSVILAVAVTFAAGVATERLVFAQFYDRERFFVYSFFASFGITVFFEDLLRFLYGGEIYSVPHPPLGSVSIIGVSVGILELGSAVVAVVLLGGLTVFTRKTYAGLAIRALADSKPGARIIGVDETYIYMLTFGLGAAITGVTGILYGMIFSVSPTLGVELTAFAFIVIVVGGIGSFSGTIIASLLIGVVESLTASFVGSRYRLIVIFSLLFLILALYPTGLRGEN